MVREPRVKVEGGLSHVITRTPRNPEKPIAVLSLRLLL